MINKYESKVNKLRERGKELYVLISQARTKNIDTSYPLVTLTTLQEVIPCVEMDIKEAKSSKTEFILGYLEDASEKAIEEVKGLLSGEKKALKIPQYDLSKLKIKKGFFYKEDEPIILLGVLPPQYYVRPSKPYKIMNPYFKSQYDEQLALLAGASKPPKEINFYLKSRCRN